MRAAILLALAAFGAGAAPALAQPREAGGSPCGGDAYSSAEVTEGRAPRRGPLGAVPDTLCADLEGPRDPVAIEVYGVPGPGGRGRADRSVGARAPGAPYDPPSRPGTRPPGY